MVENGALDDLKSTLSQYQAAVSNMDDKQRPRVQALIQQGQTALHQQDSATAGQVLGQLRSIPLKAADAAAKVTMEEEEDEGGMSRSATQGEASTKDLISIDIASKIPPVPGKKKEGEEEKPGEQPPPEEIKPGDKVPEAPTPEEVEEQVKDQKENPPGSTDDPPPPPGETPPNDPGTPPEPEAPPEEPTAPEAPPPTETPPPEVPPPGGETPPTPEPPKEGEVPPEQEKKAEAIAQEAIAEDPIDLVTGTKPVPPVDETGKPEPPKEEPKPEAIAASDPPREPEKPVDPNLPQDQKALIQTAKANAKSGKQPSKDEMNLPGTSLHVFVRDLRGGLKDYDAKSNPLIWYELHYAPKGMEHYAIDWDTDPELCAKLSTSWKKLEEIKVKKGKGPELLVKPVVQKSFQPKCNPACTVVLATEKVPAQQFVVPANDAVSGAIAANKPGAKPAANPAASNAPQQPAAAPPAQEVESDRRLKDIDGMDDINDILSKRGY